MERGTWNVYLSQWPVQPIPVSLIGVRGWERRELLTGRASRTGCVAGIRNWREERLFPTWHDVVPIGPLITTGRAFSSLQAPIYTHLFNGGWLS
jgi:hypothetical protein